MNPCMSICLSLVLVTWGIPLRAANGPHAGTERQTKVWTNDDLEGLHDPGLISIVGLVDPETSPAEPASGPPDVSQDPGWYAAQVASLRDELEHRQDQLREYVQAINDARSLRESAGGIDLVGQDFAITPEAGIEILRQRVSDTQTKLDALEDLARRNDIEPGQLRGQ